MNQKLNKMKIQDFLDRADLDRNSVSTTVNGNSYTFTIFPRKLQKGWMYDIDGMIAVYETSHPHPATGETAHVFSLLIDLNEKTLTRNFSTTSNKFFAVNQHIRREVKYFLRDKVSKSEIENLK